MSADDSTQPAAASDHAAAPVLALVRDLMFVARITAEARHAAVAVKVIRDPRLLASERGRLLILDLNLAGAIKAAAAWKQAGGATAAGFVSHVDGATIQKARAAGIDHVMARSHFVQVLPALLTGRASDLDPVPSDEG